MSKEKLSRLGKDDTREPLSKEERMRRNRMDRFIGIAVPVKRDPKDRRERKS